MKKNLFHVLGCLLVAFVFGLGVSVVPAAGSDEKGKDLMGAAIQGDLDAVKSLVESGVDVNYTEENSKATPLIGASWRGNTEVVKYLVSRGANVNAKNAFGDTPLIVAAGSKNFKELVPYLLSKGADPTAVRQDNMNAVWNLVVRLGRDDSKDLTATAKLLVDKGASVNLPINKDFTPLMFASREGDLEMVRFLVENGAEVNAKTEDGRTPLSLAEKEGHGKVASYLKSRGAGE